MVTLLLKKSYRHKDLKEVKFHDLWDSYGVFTTMRVIGKPAKILFFREHIENLIRSLKVYKINKKSIKQNIFKLIKLNLKKNKKYDHLFRVAANNKMISISLRKRFKPKSNFSLKLINYKRIEPEYKNLKYKKIMSFLKKMDTTKSDIALYKNKKILESGTSNLLFIKKNKIYSPIDNFYRGTTLKFFTKKIKKIKKINIFTDSLNDYDEIIVIGSGKGVVSVNSIEKPFWKRKSLKNYRILSKIYQQAVTNCPRYNS
jgi:branched-subunit amino acid aminotransferase/4-amino-4-deoxychorismate lyase